FATDPSPELVGLAGETPRGRVTICRRAWSPADFADATIAVGAIEDDGEAARFAAAARAARIPVNVGDNPALSEFTLGAIVNRSPLVIAISTGGAAPVFGQAIRARIEALIPKSFARWARAARNWRPRVQALGLTFRGRRLFWERFCERALTRPSEEPGAA